MLVSAPALPYQAPAKPGGAAYILAVILSALAGMIPSLLRSAVQGPVRRRLTFGMSAVLVLWVLIGLWLPLYASGFPPRGYGPLLASQIRPNPMPGAYVNDDALYRRVFYLMHEGKPYYMAVRDAWQGSAIRPHGQPNPMPASPFGVRLPTYYWLWRLLPPDAFTILHLFLALASAGVVAAASIAGQLVGPRLAPLAALTVATYAFGVGSSVVAIFVDLPATSIALVGVALFLLAARTRRMPVLWGAAAIMVFVVLTREILIYLVLLAACSAALEPPGERAKRALPWLAAIAVFAMGYALHYVAVRPYLSSINAQSWARGGVAFVVDSLTRFSVGYAGEGLSLVCFVALGIIGAIASRRRAGAAFSAFAAAAIVLPLVAMLRIGNPAVDVQGHVQSYWGNLVLPLALALWPASALLVPRRRGQLAK